MGNTCRCIRPAETAQIEIVVDDTRNVRITDFRAPAGNITKIKFILPIIKVTNDKNEEYLVYHPEAKTFSDYQLSTPGGTRARPLEQPSTSNDDPQPVIAQPSGSRKDFLDPARRRSSASSSPEPQMAAPHSETLI